MTIRSSWVIGAGLALGGALQTGQVLAQAQMLPRWTAVPDLTLDGRALDLVPVSWVMVSSAGRVFVAQSQDYAVRMFASDGTPLGSFGRRGSGPGEFRYGIPGRALAGLTGDSLWWWHVPQHDVYVQPPTTKGSRKIVTAPFKTARSAGLPAVELRWDSVRFVYPDGSLLADLAPRARSDSGAAPPALIVHARPKGPILKVLATRPTATDHLIDPRLHRTIPLPFANPTFSATNIDGSTIGLARAILSGDSAGWVRVVAIRSTGDTAFVRRYPVSMEPIPPGVVDSTFAAMERRFSVDPRSVAFGASSPDRAAIAAAVRAAPRPSFYPPVTATVGERALWVARDGSVLLGFTRLGDDREYLVVNPQGHPLASVRLPRGVIVEQFEAGVIWAKTRDTDGFDSVIRYRLQPASPPDSTRH